MQRLSKVQARQGARTALPQAPQTQVQLANCGATSEAASLCVLAVCLQHSVSQWIHYQQPAPCLTVSLRTRRSSARTMTSRLTRTPSGSWLLTLSWRWKSSMMPSRGSRKLSKTRATPKMCQRNQENQSQMLESFQRVMMQGPSSFLRT